MGIFVGQSARNSGTGLEEDASEESGKGNKDAKYDCQSGSLKRWGEGTKLDTENQN
jgi:hypothetical protein